MNLTYVGGLPAVDVKLPSRWLFGVNRGDSVEVSEEEAERLLVLPGWEATPTHPEEGES